MLKKHGQFFRSLFFLSDLFILCIAWILSYVIRFYVSPFFPPDLGQPPLLIYVKFLLLPLILWSLVSKKYQLYSPRRISNFFKEGFDVVKCATLTTFILIAVIYLLRRFEFSRLAFFYFWAMSILGMFLVRLVARKTLWMLRKRGYNRRFVLIAGTGTLGQKVFQKIEHHPELGLHLIGFLTGNGKGEATHIKHVPILGTYDDLDTVLNEREIDILFIAIGIGEYEHFSKLIKKADGHLSEIKVVPGSIDHLGVRGGMDELGDLPVVTLQGSPLYGWVSFYKRMFDLTLGTLALAVVSPLMVVVSLLIKLTSKGPVFYSQERVGLNGHSFQILKFRTMRVDAEKETGPIWASENDSRRTPLGALLRKYSLDELPQLFNVLKGEMSLVGPRPERPYFVNEFKKNIPSYMVRHKIKAGVTGWAQVHGYRGNTSMEKRIEHDLYYIQNYSIGFDMRILLMTLYKGVFNKSAY